MELPWQKHSTYLSIYREPKLTLIGILISTDIPSGFSV